jgi:hypothetical protein
MKDVSQIGCQGDVLFRRVAGIPLEYKKQERGQELVVAHSETGHHHVIGEASVAMYVAPGDPLVCYLQLGEGACEVVHQRPFDTHEALRLLGKPGDIWEVRRQREHTPEGWRRVED